MHMVIMSVNVGGDMAARERVRPYLLALGPTITRVGPVGPAVEALPRTRSAGQ